MESTQDQVLEQSTINDQPEGVVSDKATEQSQQIFEVNGQKLTADKLVENYKSLQAEYTKARQEVSSIKKNNELSPEEKTALEFLKANGFATKEDLEMLTKSQKQESTLKEIISANPDLASYEQAIKDLSQVHGIAPEDVIEKYGFKSKDKLAKARSQGDIKGIPETKSKSVAEMSDKEYQEYKRKLGIGKGTFI